MQIAAVQREDILGRYRPISSTTHKGLQGHALVIGGSYGKIGAMILSAKAALRTGCGLVTAFVPRCGYVPLQTAIPEVMVLTDVEEKIISRIEFGIVPQAIGVGPGMGLDHRTQKTLQEFLKSNSVPMVIDADAINSLAQHPGNCAHLHPQTILTPHAKELERLIGPWQHENEKLEKAVHFAKKYNLILVLKGAPTLVLDGDTIFENTTGNPALATAGSGDVLTGIIISLLAQSYQPQDAALIGVYLHGLCADLKDEKTSTQSFIASDIIANLGVAFRSLGV